MFAALRMLAVYVLLGVPAALLGIAWTLLRRNFDLMYRMGMGTVALGVKAAGIRVRIEGLQNLEPDRRYIFLSNHVSNLDPPVLLPSIPGMTSVLLKQELMRIPLLGTAMRLGKFVPVARGHSREEARKSVAAAAAALQGGLHIMIFPEGTRSPDGALLPFKKGAFFLAADTGAPIVPVIIKGTKSMMRKGSLGIAPGTATVRFLEPIEPGRFADRDELMLAVRGAMERALAEKS